MAGRDTDGHIHAQGETGKSLKRRGILAAAGAVVAGIMAKQTSEPVAASTPMLIANTETAGVSNNVVGPTTLAAASTFTSPQAVLIASAALAPSTGAAAALHGSVNTPSAAPEVCGVYGQSTGSFTGVLGASVSGIGVRGRSTNSIGVVGQCDASTGIGVQGQSTGGVGVFGASNGNAGVLGITTAPGNAGLSGITSTPNTAAFAGTSTVPTAFAGFFTGDVFVNGNFTVQDPTRKHGAIMHPDGTHRILYSMESPESWIEDFGAGQLVGGNATVTLDPDFAAVTHIEEYHVFLTMYDSAQLLYVTNRTAGGCEQGVQLAGGGEAEDDEQGGAAAGEVCDPEHHAPRPRQAA